MCTRTQGKGTVTSQETRLWVSGNLQQRCGLAVACRSIGGTDCSSTRMGSKEVTIIFITFTIVWPQVNSRQGTQLHPSIENWIKALLSMALPIRRPSFPFSQSIPSGASISILYFSIRGQTLCKSQSQKTNQSNHMDHNLV